MKKFIKLTSAVKNPGIVSGGSPVYIELEAIRAIERGQIGAQPQTGQGGKDCTVVAWAHSGGGGVIAVSERPADVMHLISEAQK